MDRKYVQGLLVDVVHCAERMTQMTAAMSSSPKINAKRTLNKKSKWSDY
jgi:hypothetical protein